MAVIVRSVMVDKNPHRNSYLCGVLIHFTKIFLFSHDFSFTRLTLRESPNQSKRLHLIFNLEKNG